jgi:predicted ATPase
MLDATDSSIDIAVEAADTILSIARPGLPVVIVVEDLHDAHPVALSLLART